MLAPPDAPPRVLGISPGGHRRLVRALLTGGLGLLAVAVAVPFFGWAGLQSQGPTVAIGAGALVLISRLVGAGGPRRPVLLLATAAAVTAIVLVITRLSTAPSNPDPAVQTLLRQSLSRGCLAVALAGAVLVTAAALLSWITPGAGPPAALSGRWVLAPAGRLALRDAAVALVVSRVLIWCVAIGAVVLLGVHADVGPGSLDRPFGSLGRTIVAPATAWDSATYLGIARSGYAGGLYFDAFFPLYPILIRLFAWSPQAAVISAILISLAASTVALALLHRLVSQDYGTRVARLTVALVACFPTSLFLAASVGAIYAARNDAWGWAGAAGAVAAAARSDGALILLPLGLMYLYGPRTARAPAAMGRPTDGWWPRYPVRRDAGWLLLVPLPIIAFLAYMGLHGSWLAPLHAERTYWGRAFVPVAGLWRGFIAAPRDSRDLVDAAFLLLGLVALSVTLRTLAPAYGAYALISILVPLSTVSSGEPLQSLPRFLLVDFPLWLALARWADRRRWRAVALLVPSGLAMVVCAGVFARGGWIA